MRETTFENCKVGDRCWTPFGSEVEIGETNGEIANVSHCHGLFTVKLDEGYIGDKYKVFYTTGSFLASYPQTCFWSRPEIIAPERPVREEWVEVEIRPRKYPDGSIIMPHLGDTGYVWDDGEWCGPIQTVKVKVTR